MTTADARAALLAGTAGGGLAASGLHPTGVRFVDLVLAAVLGATLVLAARRATGRALLLAWAPLVVLAQGWAGAAACMCGAAGALGRAALTRRSPAGAGVAGAVGGVAGAVGGVAMVAVVPQLGDGGTTGLSAAAVAVSLLVFGTAEVRRASTAMRRRVLRVGALAVGCVGFVVALAALGAWQARGSVAAAQVHLRAALADVRSGDADAARVSLARAAAEIDSALLWTDAFWQRPARVLPVVAPNLRATVDVLHAIDAAVERLRVTADVADLDGLALVDGRVDLDSLRRLAADVDTTADAVLAVDAAVTGQTSPWLMGALTDRLAGVADTIADVRVDLVRTRDVLAVAPRLLGGDGDRTYLAVFVTPSEARGGGGFPGQMAEIVVRDGEVSLGRQFRIRDLDPAPGTTIELSGVDEYLARYGAFRVASDWRNITMSPHFPSVAATASQFFEQVTGTAVDGVVRIGPRAFTALVDLTGPLTVEGLGAPLTARNAYEFFTRGQYDDALFPSSTERVAVLEAVVEATMRSLTSQRFGDPRRIGETLAPVIAAGDLAVWTPVGAETDALSAIGLGGGLPALDGDSLLITQHDLLTNKIGSYLRRTIEYDAQVTPVGDERAQVDALLTVTLTNDAPAAGPVVILGNTEGLPLGTMRELVTVFSPLAVDDLRLDGTPLPSLTQKEQGRYAVSATVEIAPGSEVVLTARLVGTVPLTGGTYRLTMPVVPSVNFDRLSVSVDGERILDRVLDRVIRVDVAVR